MATTSRRSTTRPDELDIDEELVTNLVRQQFSEWSGLAVRRIEPMGTDNVVFRLGDQMAVRLPRADGPDRPGGTVWDWQSRMSAELPVEVPVPVAQGVPGLGYPWFWQIHSWIEGATVPVDAIDTDLAARDLAAVIRSLARIESGHAPPGRGVPLATRDADIRHWFDRFQG